MVAGIFQIQAAVNFSVNVLFVTPIPNDVKK
jgi:hypothetical protein